MFQISYTDSALEDISTFRKNDQTVIFDTVDEQLIHQPDVITRNRKRLRSNASAEWQLKIGDFRVLYDIDAAEERVEVKFVGQKQGAKLLVRGREFVL
jgi:mRNA-degrading endonuclease RelE of RelBE toxin-antitoxin system